MCVFFCKFYSTSEKVSQSPSTVWVNLRDRRRCVVCGHPGEWMHSDPLLPLSTLRPPFYVSLSLRRLHPRAWRWRSSGPSSGQNASVSTAVLLPLLFPPPSSFPALLHLCLYLSLLLKMLSPSLVPQGSSWWKNKGGGSGMEQGGGGDEGIGGKEEGGKGGEKKEGGEHLT